MSFLHGINSPKDLKQIRRVDLPKVSKEIRSTIIEACSLNGGHLGASLGATDLIVALHYVFNMPQDKMIWDVGHQAYAHKALTGRKDRLNTLRKTNGLSGFPKRDESPYDTFGTAHASTGISAALGVKTAKSLKGKKDNVVVVVGDGGLTGGLSYEGLNQAGHLKDNLIVVLNDNGMSIAQNVGAITQFLTKRASSELYEKSRQELKNLLSVISEHGVPLLRPIEKIRKSLKSLFSSGIFFESLGFRYLGPFDGHDIETMVDVFENLKHDENRSPVLVHVITQKGKGYAPAENDPLASHGVKPFDIETGKSLPQKKAQAPSYTNVFAQALIKCAQEDQSIVGITAAMPSGTGIDLFQKEFPNRTFDVGIAEQHATVFAAGLATEGIKPACAIYSTFLQRAFDPIIHDVALQNLPVHFFLDRSGFVGDDGATHHGVFDVSYLRCIPNMVIMAPKDENELQHMVKTSFEQNQPTVVRYPRGNGVGVHMDETLKSLPIGKSEIAYPTHVTDEELLSSDVALIALGSMVPPAIQAAKVLKEHGIHALVLNARFVKPLDEDMILKLCEAIPHLVTLEENVLMGGFGSAVLELFSQKSIQKTVHRMGIPDRFFDHATPNELLSMCNLHPEGIVKFVQEKLGKPFKKSSPVSLVSLPL